MTTATKIFDAKRDAELVVAGTHFWCQGCFLAKPLSEHSPDPRYCRGCHDFLLEEAELQNTRKSWMPKPAKKAKSAPRTETGTPPRQPLSPEVRGTQFRTTPTPPRPIMSTSTSPKRGVDIITSSADKITGAKRGPKHKALPEDLITRWAQEESMGSKAIAARLKTELGITISYKTIQRLLSGERQLPLPM